MTIIKTGCFKSKEDIENGIERNKKPHIAIVTMKVDVRALNPDGTMDEAVLGDGILDKYGIARMGRINVIGFSEADCINKTKKMLEKMENG